MTLPAAGNPISINSLVGEYGGSGSHSLSEYYRGGSFVANHSNNANVPTSGTISLSDFYGQSNTSPAPTVYNYTLVQGNVSQTDSGFIASNSHSHGGTAFGSLSNNPQSTAFSNGFNPTITAWFTKLVSGKAIATDLIFEVSGVYSNSGWTSITMGAAGLTVSSDQTLQRSAATFANLGNSTRWRFQSIGFSYNTALSGGPRAHAVSVNQ